MSVEEGRRNYHIVAFCDRWRYILAVRALQIFSERFLESDGGYFMLMVRLGGVLALLFAFATTASADFKQDFKKGCESGGHSFVENASSDTFACNLKSGGTISCSDADGKKPCTYSARISHTNIFRGMQTDQIKIFAPASKPEESGKPEKPAKPSSPKAKPQ